MKKISSCRKKQIKKCKPLIAKQLLVDINQRLRENSRRMVAIYLNKKNRTIEQQPIQADTTINNKIELF